MATVGDYFASTVIRGINEGIGTPGLVQSMHGTPKDGTLELPVGEPGPPGPQGPPAAPFRWEGDISDPVALAALTADLLPKDAGKAWRVESTNTLVYWDGTAVQSFADAFGAHGPTGEPNTLSIGTVTTGAAGTDLQVTVTGTPPAQTLDVVIPRGVQGVKGEPGGPGPIRQAPDYDNTTPPSDGWVPMWVDATSKWTPSPNPGWRGPWTITEAQAWDGGAGFAASVTNTATTPLTLAQLHIPAQDTAWRPHVTGGVQLCTVATDASVRVDVEARIGSASGQIVALGAGMPHGVWWYAQLQPQLQTSALAPDSSVGVIAAGTAVTLFIVARRNLGTGNFHYSRTYSHVAVWAVPVTGAP
ncbi:hypothetical protein IU414_06650 [Nocardia farcinica]|uniref:hypothetical protein n=1 Tax=Nocardia farcinica TaxID=37329 RepID=UPI0018949B9B|nr:hypothetical protein [Nocardia farcinica]MBF6584439.1 hypothetical protein [Nocardia farcinica]